MGTVITIIGNVGVGKTTASRGLAHEIGGVYFAESHDDRPFQRLASADKRFTFHNQVNYLLTRAQQEESARLMKPPAVFDGGLDMDLYIFTRLFYENGALQEAEYNELIRLGAFFRRHLPHPEVVILLNADSETIKKRYLSRNRINLASVADMSRIDALLQAYINTIQTSKLIFYDTTDEDVQYNRFKQTIGQQL